jgi:hypothetical protein
VIRIEEVTGAISFSDLADAINALTKTGERVVNVETHEYEIGDAYSRMRRLRGIVVLEEVQ